MNSKSTFLASGLALAVFAGACSSSVTPEVTRIERVLLDTDDTNVPIADPHGGRIVALAGPVGRLLIASASLPDSSVIVQSTVADDGKSELLAIDPRTASVVWRDELRVIAARAPVALAGLTITSGALAPSGDGRRLLMARATHGGESGVLLLSLAARVPQRFRGPMTVTALASLGTTGVVALGTRDPGALPTSGALYLLDDATLEVRDSTVLQPEPDDAPGYVEQLLAASDGRTVYLVGPRYIYRYDMIGRRKVAVVIRPSRGTIALLDAVQRIVVTDPGDGRESPGSGHLFVYTLALQPAGSVALGTPAVPVPRTARATASRDGTKAYIGAGLERIGPLYGPQPTRLLVVDVLERRIVHDISVGGTGIGALVTTPP